jgi:hypothetical protein
VSKSFPTFWPTWDHFYKPLTGIAPGEVPMHSRVPT